ncbi:MAG: UDP-3-O-acyl-N-acetylglucosamine deacetylase [Hyphomicrobiales bacterium]|nr:UDP-3-O-acyl-N-acetylglucosamine deacetylase [Hyphomicrobiales bacterium]
MNALRHKTFGALSAWQTTLADRVELKGLGVHSNAPVTVVLHPADADSGVVFQRTGIEGRDGELIPAKWSSVSMTELCTVIGEQQNGSVATIEHLMSALAGLGIDNVLVEIDGPEVPILDGSSAHFVEAIDEVGIVQLDSAREYVKVLKPVRVDIGRGFAELLPAEAGFRLEVEIDFESPVVGRQARVFDLDPAKYRTDISAARTFGFLRDVERLWKAGFALGASLENTVALEDERVINPEGLRYPDEFVRHKTLDAIGDLALAGAPLIGHYRSYCGGHKLNVAVLEALFSDPDAFTLVKAQHGHRRHARGGAVTAVAPLFGPEIH